MSEFNGSGDYVWNRNPLLFWSIGGIFGLLLSFYRFEIINFLELVLNGFA